MQLYGIVMVTGLKGREIYSCTGSSWWQSGREDIYIYTHTHSCTGLSWLQAGMEERYTTAAQDRHGDRLEWKRDIQLYRIVMVTGWNGREIYYSCTGSSWWQARMEEIYTVVQDRHGERLEWKRDIQLYRTVMVTGWKGRDIYSCTGSSWLQAGREEIYTAVEARHGDRLEGKRYIQLCRIIMVTGWKGREIYSCTGLSWRQTGWEERYTAVQDCHGYRLKGKIDIQLYRIAIVTGWKEGYINMYIELYRIIMSHCWSISL